MDSKLPVDTLGKIWDLADMDKDGMLDRHEFMVVRTVVELLQICRSLLSHSFLIKKNSNLCGTYICPSVCDLLSAPTLFVRFS